jgi:hypothetical protein
MNTLVHALAAVGITKPDSHCVVFRSWDTINFLAKISAFTPHERAVITRFLDSRQFDLLYPVPAADQTVLKRSRRKDSSPAVTTESSSPSSPTHHKRDLSEELSI